MSAADKQITEILAQYGEPFAGSVWRVQGTAVIYHKALERIAAQARITYAQPQIIRQERDEAVILVTGRMGEREEWSIGEALVGVNYRVSGKQAAYVWAMAEKRAKDRVILKLVGLHGLLYSEEEADEFKESRGGTREAAPAREDRSFVAGPAEPADDAAAGAPADPGAALRTRIDAQSSINAVTDLMLDPATQWTLAGMAVRHRNDVRDYAKARLVALGWPSQRGQAAQASARPRDATVREKARNHTAQAAMLCQDEAFRAYLGAVHEHRCDDEHAAAEALRELCNVASRADLNTDPAGATAFRGIVKDFGDWKAERSARELEPA